MNVRLFYITLILSFGMIFWVPGYSAPKEIILIRHADKLNQANPGPFLSPTGVIRAERFAAYYLKHYPTPDYIIATRRSHSSDRELQTVMPLVTLIAERHGREPVLLSDKYKHRHLAKLSADLLDGKKFDDKVVLICWHHGGISELLDELGIKPHQRKLGKEDYDTVYDVTFVKGIAKLRVYHNQYPIK